MTQHSDIQELMQGVANKSLGMIESLQKNPGGVAKIIRQFIDVTEDYQNLLVVCFNNPEQVISAQIGYWQDASGLMQEQMKQWLHGESMPITDRRFAGEEWEKNPFFNMLSQHYLLATEHFNAMLSRLEYGDPQVEKRLRFFTRQMLDALSPTNYLYTNPQLLAETIQSHGGNLIQGLKNFLDDLDNDSSRLVMKMTDMNAFTVGENLAITPGKVVYKNDMMELIQYLPQTEKVKSIPLLIIPPWINKYYILDLSQHNSLIRWLVQEGITVFVISWVNPGPQYRDKSLTDYLLSGPIEAIKRIQQQLDVEQVNTLGFCIGGTLQAIMLAYLNVKKLDWVKSSTYLASMIDFSDPGDMSVYIDEAQLSRLEEEMNKQGFLDGRYMASTFNSLRANDLVWSFFVNNYLKGKPPVPFDILYWNADCTNMPAKMHSQYLRWMYLKNDLIKSGKIKIDATAIDVTTIDVPSLFVSTEKDHIAPWQTTYLGFQLMKGPKRFLLGGSGHIAGIVNPPHKNKYHYYWNPKEEQNAEEWLEKAKEYEGSWWPKWGEWLKRQSGRLTPAPEFSSLPLKALADAPGSYVFVPCGYED